MTLEQLQLGGRKDRQRQGISYAIHVNEIFGAPYRSFVTGIEVNSLIAIDRKA